MQLSIYTSKDIEVISIYRSKDGDLMHMSEMVKEMTHLEAPQLVIGDFNYCQMSTSSNSMRKYFEENQFHPLVKEPTHIEGNIIDQAHLRDIGRSLEISTELHSKYYTDHKGLAIIVKRNALMNID